MERPIESELFYVFTFALQIDNASINGIAQSYVTHSKKTCLQLTSPREYNLCEQLDYVRLFDIILQCLYMNKS